MAPESASALLAYSDPVELLDCVTAGPEGYGAVGRAAAGGGASLLAASCGIRRTGDNDVWAYGMFLWGLFTGAQPFAGMPDIQIIQSTWAHDPAGKAGLPQVIVAVETASMALGVALDRKEACIDSMLACMPDLGPHTPLLVVLDGFNVAAKAKTKKGAITADMVGPYEAYHEGVIELCRRKGFREHRVVRLPTHHGFALAVKHGLELCRTTYCLVAQHDRVFRHTFRRLRDVVAAMERHEYLRYVGFPTATSSSHAAQLQGRYNLDCLNSDDDARIALGGNMLLQPCVFWYDSQHLAHRDRYLEIYRPFETMSQELRVELGYKFVKDMVLRPGDFIEDRFGQMQRRCYIGLAQRGARDEEVKAWCRWFGCFLVWTPRGVHDRCPDWAIDMAAVTAREMAARTTGGEGVSGESDGGGGNGACSSNSSVTSSSSYQQQGRGVGGYSGSDAEAGEGGERAGEQQGQEQEASPWSGQGPGGAYDEGALDAGGALVVRDGSGRASGLIGEVEEEPVALAHTSGHYSARVYVSHLRGRHFDFSRKGREHREQNERAAALCAREKRGASEAGSDCDAEDRSTSFGAVIPG